MANFLLLLVLGTSNLNLLQDRWEVALGEYQTCPRDSCKFLFTGTPFELEHFKKLAATAQIPVDALLWEPLATNTAGNAFFSLPLVLERGIEEVFCITSEFHLARAKKIFSKVWTAYSGKLEWKTGTKTCPFCWSDEVFHFRNLEADVSALLV